MTNKFSLGLSQCLILRPYTDIHIMSFSMDVDKYRLQVSTLFLTWIRSDGPWNHDATTTMLHCGNDIVIVMPLVKEDITCLPSVMTFFSPLFYKTQLRVTLTNTLLASLLIFCGQPPIGKILLVPFSVLFKICTCIYVNIRWIERWAAGLIHIYSEYLTQTCFHCSLFFMVLFV